MTLPMVFALAITVFMIVLIMIDRLPFGVPPLIACLLMVVFGVVPINVAFSGFANATIIMLASFMAVIAALQKTDLVSGFKRMITRLGTKGGFRAYVLIVVFVMVGCSIFGTGSTAYYVLVIGLLSTLAYNKKLPPSKVLMPAGFAANHPMLPFNVALQYGIVVAVLEAAGVRENIDLVRFSIVNLVLSLGFLVWCLIAYRLLPDHAITDEDAGTASTTGAKEPALAGARTTAARTDRAGTDGDPASDPAAPGPHAAEANATATAASSATATVTPPTLDRRKQLATYACFVLAIAGMISYSYIGDAGYAITGLSVALLLVMKVLDFTEIRDAISQPIIIMSAGVIGIAEALGATGLTKLVGESVAGLLGGNVSPFLLVFAFCVLTSVLATLTGSTIGTVYVFAPLAIATCVSLGLNPAAAAVAIVISGWNGHFLPIDGLPAMVMGVGKYSLLQFWKFTIPMYFIRLLALTAGALLLFPM
ncbi:membrane transport protein [Curtobacterium sp. SGAir0471]|uniref:SLC13 family permease n=1 Tax=Curtobacterium sp. SGAir0471 TaxID=2070337 RepID=UPI0010CD43EE|nr:SLC13 family permease [Curtobacterium sp. SGAir0471]QCR42679.1 membrane transport protein [Curtobacterium sp. SGAir0471]